MHEESFFIEKSLVVDEGWFNLKEENVWFVFEALEQILRTILYKASLKKENFNTQCTMCDKQLKSVGHYARGCTGSVQRE